MRRNNGPILPLAVQLQCFGHLYPDMLMHRCLVSMHYSRQAFPAAFPVSLFAVVCSSWSSTPLPAAGATKCMYGFCRLTLNLVVACQQQQQHRKCNSNSSALTAPTCNASCSSPSVLTVWAPTILATGQLRKHQRRLQQQHQQQVRQLAIVKHQLKKKLKNQLNQNPMMMIWVVLIYLVKKYSSSFLCANIVICFCFLFGIIRKILQHSKIKRTVF